MKIRHGFVSNSSSSNFVVAFPKKPQSAEDVMLFLYGSNFPQDFASSLSPVFEIANVIFSEIKEKKSLSREDVVKEFQYRFSYYDAKNGFFEEFSKYCGTDKTSIDKLVEISVKQDEEVKRIDEKIRNFIDHLLKKVNYASVSSGYTKEQEEEYETYRKELNNIMSNNKDYKKLNEQRFSIMSRYRKEIDALCIKIAESDADAFLRENKDCFIAVFNFSDDTPLGSAMEHGNIFSRLQYERISNH